MMRRFGIALVLAFLAAPGCSPGRMAMEQAIDMSLRAQTACDRETEAEFGGLAVAGQIKLLEGLLESSSADPRLLLALTRAYSRYAYGYTQLQIDCARYLGNEPEAMRRTEQAIGFYGRARAYGMRLLALNHRAFAKAVDSDLSAEGLMLEELTAHEAAALFWTAFAWGNELALQPMSPQTLQGLQQAAQCMRRVTELDERMACGGAHLFLGCYFSRLPALLGGDAGLADAHFLRARQLEGDVYLPARLVQVDQAWLATGDTSSYASALRELIAAPDGTVREYGLDNAIARRKAAVRLAVVDPSYDCGLCTTTLAAGR